MNPTYPIRLATQEDLPALESVEREAGERFKQLGFPEPDADMFLTAEDYLPGIKAKRIWVAETAECQVIGFAFAEKIEGIAHLKEIDVLQTYGRQGIGRTLIEHVKTWAMSEGSALLTLTTFRDVAWNGPYYKKLGFREMKESEMTESIKDILVKERETLVDGWARTAMVLALKGPSAGSG